MPEGFTRRTLLSAGLAVLTPAVVQARGLPPYRNPQLPLAQRVDDLLARMTLEEKAAQMQSMWFGRGAIQDDDGAFSPGKARQALAQGVGQIGRPSDRMGSATFAQRRWRSIEDTVAFVNAVQRFLAEHTRLGIPALFHEETAHGLVAAHATVFPSPLALGSTWDPALVEQVFTVVAREARLRGATLALSPVLDLARDARWGRVEEFFGEDPYHVARMGVASVHGHQGRERPLGSERVYVTLKHFIHGTPAGGLNVAPADLSERTLRNLYQVPFAAAIEAGAAGVMPSYNEVSGVPAHAHRELLQQAGRERLGFRGVYFSDYMGIQQLMSHHRMAADLDEAAVLALEAGVDAELPDARAYARLPALVRGGRIAEARLDDAVRRILLLKFEAGLFENPYADAARAVRETATAADRQLARRAAEKAIVLLKNEGGLLPLDPALPRRLAVIGPNAAPVLLGGYSGEPAQAVSVLDGLRAAAQGTALAIEHADGVWITPPTEEEPSHAPLQPVPQADNAARIAQAVELARRCDLVLLVLGDNPTVTREALTITRPSGRVVLPGDRSTLGLYGDQDALVEAVQATGKPIVALLLNGRPLATPRLADVAQALLEGWYLGQEGGHAVADVLFGRANPGGKLPVAIPRAAGELPMQHGRHPSAGLNAYIEGRSDPLFPFGHGLSYTRFELSAPCLSQAEIGVDGLVTVTVDVANTGTRAGDEVVQLYLRDDVSSVPRPLLELVGFERVTLAPGERRSVRFELGAEALGLWNLQMRRVVETGSFTLSAGNSSAALKSVVLRVV